VKLCFNVELLFAGLFNRFNQENKITNFFDSNSGDSNTLCKFFSQELLKKTGCFGVKVFKNKMLGLPNREATELQRSSEHQHTEFIHVIPGRRGRSILVTFKKREEALDKNQLESQTSPSCIESFLKFFLDFFTFNQAEIRAFQYRCIRDFVQKKDDRKNLESKKIDGLRHMEKDPIAIVGKYG